MFFGLFLLFSYSFKCFSWRSSKMTSFPLYFLLLFILFPSVLSLLCLFLFSRFFLLSLPYFILLVSLLSLCFFMSKSVGKKYLFELLQNSVFLSSLFHQNLSFLCFLFLLGLFQTNIYFSMFCFSVSWKMVSHFVWLSFFYSSCKLCFFFLLSFFWCIQE